MCSSKEGGRLHAIDVPLAQIAAEEGDEAVVPSAAVELSAAVALSAALTGCDQGPKPGTARGSGSVKHAQTFSHTPIICAAGLAAVRHVKKHGLVERCARFKLDVVAGDPEERGQRIALNLGHSLGHGRGDP